MNDCSGSPRLASPRLAPLASPSVYSSSLHAEHRASRRWRGKTLRSTRRLSLVAGELPGGLTCAGAEQELQWFVGGRGPNSHQRTRLQGIVAHCCHGMNPGCGLSVFLRNPPCKRDPGTKTEEEKKVQPRLSALGQGPERKLSVPTAGGY